MVGRVFVVGLLLASISCGADSGLIPITGVGATGNGSTLLVGISLPDIEGRSCWADVNITVSAELEVVRLDVRGRKSHAPDCAPSGPIRVTLPKPLGLRTVRDGATGQPASLLPLPIPEITWLPDGWKVLVSSGGEDGWFQQVGVEGSLIGGQLNLFRTGTNGDLRGATIESPATVQGRSAAFVKERYRTSGPDALLVMDADWSLMVWSYSDAVTKDTLQRLAEGVTPLPFAPTIDEPTLEAPRTGTVAELIDYEGPTNLTGWLTIDAEGHAQFCESLAADGACEGATVDVDWETGNATPPTGLVPKGDRKVSDRTLSLSGTLKGRLFYVGL